MPDKTTLLPAVTEPSLWPKANGCPAGRLMCGLSAMQPIKYTMSPTKIFLWKQPCLSMPTCRKIAPNLMGGVWLEAHVARGGSMPVLPTPIAT